jgi:hypothetical protein
MESLNWKTSEFFKIHSIYSCILKQFTMSQNSLVCVASGSGLTNQGSIINKETN